MCGETHLSTGGGAHGEAEERGLGGVTLHLELGKAGGVALDGLADLALDRVELHGTDNTLRLSSDSDQQEPLLLLVSAVVDDLAASQVGMALEHLHWLRCT